ncbi:MAG: tRNA (adenosine(37)-N6)-dimethylallyltransferase MiaA [Candidatus Marinimicrobia bacterium]|nr:tRNA (adenosine(37)-N6)-dimethylallyltransferase MiaA [Candidatus Neomarinimicrobiota bacterium]
MRLIKDLRENRIVPVITGPTAVGKTDVGIALAKMLDGEVISVDSRQIYKGLDIGTSKPTLKQQKEVKHYLIDILEVDEKISAGRYRKLVAGAIERIFSHEKIPILVGGAGLYIKAIVHGLFEESWTNEEIRKKVWEELKRKGRVELYNRLLDIDPEYAIKIHINDVKRITRAIEIYEMTGQPPTKLFKKPRKKLPYSFRIFILNMKRNLLYERINKRVERMIQDGLIEEVKEFVREGKREAMDYLLTLGYKEVIQYLDGKCSMEEMVENLKRNTRRYAKRQLTWFRNQLDGIWVEVGEGETPVEVAKRVLKFLLYETN